MNQSLTRELEEMTPRDVCLEKPMREKKNQTVEDADKSVEEYLAEKGIDPSEEFEEGYVEVSSYIRPELTWASTLGECRDMVMEQFPMLDWEQEEELISLSEYNRMAEYYGISQYELAEDEYILLCTFDTMKNIRDTGLSVGTPLTIGTKQYTPKYLECQEGYLSMSSSRTVLGIFILPDSAFEEEGFVAYHNYLAADYPAGSEDERRALEERISAVTDGTPILVTSKINLRESSVGIAAIVTFIALYLGIIFLISSAAVLALKELSDSSDNRERYRILREIGADQGMIRSALFRQIGIFFLLPLILAFIHSVFGVQFVNRMLVLANQGSQQASMIFTAVFILLIYGGYFLATYLGSRRIIEEVE